MAMLQHLTQGAKVPVSNPSARPTMIIRHAEQNDKEGARIVRASVLSQDHPYPYEDNIGLRETLNLVAEEDCVILGFVSVLLARVNPKGQYLWERLAPYIGFIGVMTRQQRKGIGSSLLRCAIEGAADRCPNEPFLYLEHEVESSARQFYERMGFRVMSGEETFGSVGMYPKACLMRFDLH
jgi:GNAT superfamily N-acetyltransferase